MANRLSDDQLLQLIRKKNISVKTFLGSEVNYSFHGILSKIWQNGYGKFKMFAGDYNGYDVYKLYCKKNIECDPIMNNVLGATTPEELYSYLQENKLEKMLTIDIELLCNVWSDKKIVSDSYEKLKNYTFQLSEFQQKNVMVIKKMLEYIKDNSIDDQWFDFVKSVISNKITYILKHLLCVSDHKFIESCITDDSESFFIDYVNKQYNLLNDNPLLFIKYYIPSDKTNLLLLKMNLEKNDINAVKHISSLLKSSEPIDIKFGIFSPFHYAEYHINNELFNLLERYYDKKYFDSTPFLTDFVEVAKIGSFGFDKLEEKKGEMILSISSSSSDNCFYLGEKDGVGYFIFSDTGGCKQMGLRGYKYKVSQHNNIEYLQSIRGKIIYNQDNKFEPKFTIDALTQILDNVFVHYHDVNRLDFIQFNSQTKYIMISEINNGIELKNSTEEISLCYDGGYGGSWGKYNISDEKYDNLAVLNKFKNYGDNTFLIPKIGWFKLVDNFVVRGYTIELPFSITINKINLTDKKIECSWTLSQDNKRHRMTDNFTMYKLIITNDNHHLTV